MADILLDVLNKKLYIYCHALTIFSSQSKTTFGFVERSAIMWCERDPYKLINW